MNSEGNGEKREKVYDFTEGYRNGAVAEARCTNGRERKVRGSDRDSQKRSECSGGRGGVKAATKFRRANEKKKVKQLFL